MLVELGNVSLKYGVHGFNRWPVVVSGAGDIISGAARPTRYAMIFATLLVVLPTIGRAEGFFSKHYYCVVKHEGLGPRCQTCWTYTGGEGGRVSCGYVYGPGTVRYGSCDEKRNRPPC